MAVYSNQPEIVAKLISRGADVNVQILSSAPSGTCAKYAYYCLLHYAASRGHEWMATLCELLKATNINLDAINSYGKMLVGMCYFCWFSIPVEYNLFLGSNVYVYIFLEQSHHISPTQFQ